MQKLTIIIIKGEFFIFSGKEHIFIEGNPSFLYQLNRVTEDISNLLERLSHTYNLRSPADLSLSIVTNEDNLITETVIKAFRVQECAAKIENVFEINHVISAVIKQLSNDITQHIEEFGINFDGVCYKLNDNLLEKLPFSLLARTINAPEIADYIN